MSITVEQTIEKLESLPRILVCRDDRTTTQWVADMVVEEWFVKHSPDVIDLIRTQAAKIELMQKYQRSSDDQWVEIVKLLNGDARQCEGQEKSMAGLVKQEFAKLEASIKVLRQMLAEAQGDKPKSVRESTIDLSRVKDQTDVIDAMTGKRTADHWVDDEPKETSNGI